MEGLGRAGPGSRAALTQQGRPLCGGPEQGVLLGEGCLAPLAREGDAVLGQGPGRADRLSPQRLAGHAAKCGQEEGPQGPAPGGGVTWGSHDLGAEGELHQRALLAPGEGRGRDLPECSPPHASLLSPNPMRLRGTPVLSLKAKPRQVTLGSQAPQIRSSGWVSAMPGAASLSPGKLEGTLWARCARDDTSKRRPPCWGAVGCRAQESARRPSASGWGHSYSPSRSGGRAGGWAVGSGWSPQPPREPRAQIYAQDSPLAGHRRAES